MAEKTGCRSRMESTFKNNYELASNTKNDIENIVLLQKNMMKTWEFYTCNFRIQPELANNYLNLIWLSDLARLIIFISLICQVQITTLTARKYTRMLCQKRWVNRSTPLHIFHSMSKRLFKIVRVIEVLQSIRNNIIVI